MLCGPDAAQAAIVNASSLDEIHELESALKSGNLPAGLLK